MNYKIKLIFLTISFGLLNSCEINSPIYVPDDISYVAFSNSEAAIRENKGTLDVELYLTTYTTSAAEFSFTSSSEGLDYPAVEGVDYNLPLSNKVSFTNGIGYANVALEILDNNDKDGLKQFWLEIESGTEGYDIGIDGKHRILISIQDDEHPLKFILGRYRIVAESHFGAEWNLSHDQLVIEPDADTTKIKITNIIVGASPPLIRPIMGSVDVSKKEITVNSAQQWSNPKSNGYYISFYKGNPETGKEKNGVIWPEPLDEPFTLTWSDSGSNITISGLDNWGPKWMEPGGTFDWWWWWDYYTSATLTKVEDY